MDWALDFDWSETFAPDVPLLEIVLRGSIMYLFIWALLRFVFKREAGVVAMADLLVIVFIADAAQNAIAAGYTSISDGIVLVLTICFWSYAINWLSYHSAVMARFTAPPPLKLVEDGRILWRNLRKELITEDELETQLRKQGCDDVKDVKVAYMEPDGSISVVTNDEKGTGTPERKAV